MNISEHTTFENFLSTLATLEIGYHTGQYYGRNYGVTIERPANARIIKLFAQELGGSDFVSFNLFLLEDNQNILKPCEMSSQKVIDFVTKFQREKEKDSFMQEENTMLQTMQDNTS